MLGIVPYAGVAFTTYQMLKDRCLHDPTWARWTLVEPHEFHLFHGNPKEEDNQVQEKPDSSHKLRLKIWVHLSIGGIAGMLGQTISYPLDTIRHRMQLEGIAHGNCSLSLDFLHGFNWILGLPIYRNTWDAIKLILRKEGFRGFFIGLSINYWKTMPANAVAFVVYDKLKRLLDISEDR